MGCGSSKYDHPPSLSHGNGSNDQLTDKVAESKSGHPNTKETEITGMTVIDSSNLFFRIVVVFFFF